MTLVLPFLSFDGGIIEMFAIPHHHNYYSHFPVEPTKAQRGSVINNQDQNQPTGTLLCRLLTLPWSFLENARNFSFLTFNGIVSHFQQQIFSSFINFLVIFLFENICNFRFLTL